MQLLHENGALIEAILENQNLGRLENCVHYQQQLQQNLIRLAMDADDSPDLQPLMFNHPDYGTVDASSSANSAEQAEPARKRARVAPDRTLTAGCSVWHGRSEDDAELQLATVEKVHYDDGVPYYTVKFAANGQTRDTTSEHLFM